MDPETKNLVDKTTNEITDFERGYLKAPLGYKFRTKEFLNVIFLYTNSVDVKNPDILGEHNKNTFVYEAQAAIEKIKEQIRLDLKDLNFLIDGATPLSRFIPKAANRKLLEDNDFAVIMDEIPDNAADYGSGFLKVWEVDGTLKMRSVDPYALIFDQYNFKRGAKIERIRTTPRAIIENEKYDASPRTVLEKKTEDDKLDSPLVIYQRTQDYPDGTQSIDIVDIDNELVYYSHKTKEGEDPVVSYFKFDYKKRKGFPDALGVGCNEKIFNKLVQSKVNRERMDRVLEIASKLPFQKQIDNENDNLVGEEVTELETGVILGHKGNRLEVVNTGGEKQVALIQSQINGIIQTIGNDLNVGEALQGNTLPSGTSGVLGNLLTENSSSVLKEVKKDYAKFLDRVYRSRLIPYIIELMDSEEDLRKHLDPNDIKIIEQSVRNYYLTQEYINAEITGETFNLAEATERVKQQMKDKPIISGELLERLREETNGIRTFISGEDVSKAQVVAFLREMKATYQVNPSLFRDPFYTELLKREAEFDSGLSGVEIDLLLRQLDDLPATNQVNEPEAPAIPTA